jgi:hypothetical protein
MDPIMAAPEGEVELSFSSDGYFSHSKRDFI